MKIIRIFVILTMLLILQNSVFAEQLPSGWIAEGTDWQTPYYVIDSSIPGPTIFIIGGTHGNELAGWNAALRLLKMRPDQGQLVILPKANVVGVEVQSRKFADEGDLNRCYPGKTDGLPMELVALEIFNLIKETQPNLVLDLHESVDYHLNNNKYLGQTLIAYPADDPIWVGMMAIENINAEITAELEKFTLLQGPVEGSTAWAVGKFLNLSGITVETSRKLELETRIQYQIKIVKCLLQEYGVTLH